MTAITPSSSRVVTMPIVHRLLVHPALFLPPLSETPPPAELYSAFILLLFAKIPEVTGIKINPMLFYNWDCHLCVKILYTWILQQEMGLCLQKCVKFWCNVIRLEFAVILSQWSVCQTRIFMLYNWFGHNQSSKIPSTTR